MWKQTIMVLLMVLSIGYPQKLGEWRWADDSIKMTFDKEAHLAGSFGLYYMFKSKGFTEKQSVLYTASLGITKETIDALVPWEEYGRIGGDGFSRNDLIYNFIGIGLAYTIDKLWKPKEKTNWERGFIISRNSCTIQLVF